MRPDENKYGNCIEQSQSLANITRTPSPSKKSKELPKYLQRASSKTFSILVPYSPLSPLIAPYSLSLSLPPSPALYPGSPIHS